MLLNEEIIKIKEWMFLLEKKTRSNLFSKFDLEQFKNHKYGGIFRYPIDDIDNLPIPSRSILNRHKYSVFPGVSIIVVSSSGKETVLSNDLFEKYKTHQICACRSGRFIEN